MYRYFAEKTGTLRFCFYYFFSNIGNNLFVHYNWNALVIRIMHPSNRNIIIHGNTGIREFLWDEDVNISLNYLKYESSKPSYSWIFPFKNFHEFNDTKINKKEDNLMIFKANNFFISKKKKKETKKKQIPQCIIISRFHCRNAFELKNRATNHANND